VIGPVRRKLMVTALRERQFWVLLGRKALVWRRFVRALAENSAQDLAILRLERRPSLGWRYYVWVTYRLERTRRGRPRLVPHQLFMPADEEADSRLGTPTELTGRPFFGPDEDAPTTSEPPRDTDHRSHEKREPVSVSGPG